MRERERDPFINSAELIAREIWLTHVEMQLRLYLCMESGGEVLYFRFQESLNGHAVSLSGERSLGSAHISFHRPLLLSVTPYGPVVLH